MDYFPAFLDLNERPCLLVGGGNIALRKARLLLSAGARLTIVAPEPGAQLETLVRANEFRLIRREFQPQDVQGNWLIVSATGNPDVDELVFESASRAGIFCNSVDDKGHCSYITPAIVDRSPIVVAISSGGAAPVLARILRSQIELLLPMGISKLATLARNWRTRVRERFAGLLERRRFWEAVFGGPAASLAISGNVGAAEAHIVELLTSDHSDQAGEAWLVGAGPGDPGLLTVRALQIMQTADVILHDRLISADILALARRDADLISVGKTPGCKANGQEEINGLLVSLVASGKRVCRLKGGDPLIFGRGGEESKALADAGLACQIVPGITAAAGCAAFAGIPLTHRDLSQSVVFVTAHGKDSVDNLDWNSLARERQTIAFYMAVARLSDVKDRLIEHGRSAKTPVAVVENGTTANERVIRGNLGQLTMLAEAHRIRAPAILIVGDVAALGAEIAGLEPKHAANYAKNDYRILKKGQ